MRALWQMKWLKGEARRLWAWKSTLIGVMCLGEGALLPPARKDGSVFNSQYYVNYAKTQKNNESLHALVHQFLN